MDQILLGYIAIVSVVAVARLADTPSVVWVLLSNALVGLLIWLVRRPNLGPVGRALGDTYPLWILPGLYGALDMIAGYGSFPTHDALIQSWELALFGGQLSRDWSRQAPSALWSTVLHAAYLSYYLVVPVGPLWFLVKKDRTNMERVVLAMVGVFVICYLTFIFFPVAGPYHEFPRPSPEFLDNGPARLVYRVLEGGGSYGAAFPSSHVAAALTVAVVTAFAAPAIGLLLLVPSLLLTVAVVYCQMHYVVDSIAGIFLAIVAAAAVLRGFGPRNGNHERRLESRS